MEQAKRWLIATGVGTASVTATWLICEWWAGLDVGTSATVAALILALVAAPMAAWAGQPRPSQLMGRGSLNDAALETLPTWNVPPRSRIFVGRETQLQALKAGLGERGSMVVQALHGLGGVGKTSLAVEYAYRFAGQYELIWWVDAERAELIANQLASFGTAAGWTKTDSDIPSAAREVMDRLRTKDHWLIVFDNAEAPTTVIQWLPQGPGHVIVTSRNPGWGQVATPVLLDVLARTESVALIKGLVSTVADEDADQVARKLGDLPLAIAQASAVMSETGMSVEEYLSELVTQGLELMDDGQPPTYSTSLTQVVVTSLNRLNTEDRASVQLLEICSMMAAEPIPIDIFANSPDGAIREPLSQAARSTLRLRRTLGRIARYGLARVDHSNIQLHRLVQLIIAQQIDDANRQKTRECADVILANACPRDSRDTVSWNQWDRLMPHLLATDLARTDSSALRSAAVELAWYLLERAELARGQELAEFLLDQWRTILGPDNPQTLAAAHAAASAFRRQGRYTEIQPLIKEVFDRRCCVFGLDHLDTLNSADHLASNLRDLGDLEGARALHSETLARKTRTLGKDHRDTLGTAHNLAIDLRHLGRIDESLALNEATLLSRRRILGGDHLHTLLSANDVATDLHLLGRLDEALALCQDTLERRQRVLGVNHPVTMESAEFRAALVRQISNGLENPDAPDA
jgi:tetratricopeptide (TPR) repeat protein